MRKRMIATLAVISVLQVPNRVDAGFYATEFTQVLNHGQLVMEYIRQGEQLANELKMYADMLRQGKMLSTQVFGPIQADLEALASIVQNGMALAYSLANLDSEFRARFKGYGYNPHGYYKDYKTWFQTTLDTTLGTLRAAGVQGDQLKTEQTVLSALRAMAASSDGRMEALQVMGQIAEQQVQQLMKLRELMLADMSSKQAYQAAIVQKQAASEAATEHFFNWLPAASDGQTFQSGWK